MTHMCSFLTFDEDEKDILVSFVIENPGEGVRSLILHRSLFYEYLLADEEKGVKVSLEYDEIEAAELNILESIEFNNGLVEIKSKFRSYSVDISKVEEDEIARAVSLIKKQNSDDRFSISVV